MLRKYLPLFAFVFVGFVWGSNFVFMKLASELITPLQVVFLRVLTGFMPILVFAMYKRVLKFAHLRHFPHFVAMGLLATVVYYFGFAKGTSLLSSGIAGAISGAIPLFSLLAAVLFLKEEVVTKTKLVGSLLGFLGIVLLARPFNADIASSTALGATYMVIGAMSVGFSFVYAKRFISPLQISPLALTTYQLGTGLLILFAITDFNGIEVITHSAVAFSGTVLGLGLLGTGLAYLCYYFIIETLGALTASSVTYIPPIIALAIGVGIMGESIEYQDYVATAIILLGVCVVAVSSRTKIKQQRVE